MLSTMALIHLLIMVSITKIHALDVNISGKREIIEGKEVDVYLGIPYAEPPIGSNRFKAPRRLKKQQGVYKANKLPKSCHGFMSSFPGDFEGADKWNPNTEMSEDCLYLNVWKQARGTTPKPVMVWIHGGSFFTGTSTLPQYSGAYLSAAHDVVVVSINYRLGPFGFLYGGTSDAPGNMGLMDQQMALEWVQDNIADFGGDRERVTLFGQGAGAASVGFHLLAPSSQGLFTGAILQSGSPLADWAYETQANASKRFGRVADSLRCDHELSNRTAEIECLRDKKADEILYSDMWLEQDYISNIRPTIDGKFLTSSPLDLLKNDQFNQVPVLLGTTTNEGMYFNSFMENDFLNTTELPESEFLYTAPLIFTPDESILLNATLFEYEHEYPAIIGSPNWRNIADAIIGDSQFVCPMLEMAEHLIQSGHKVYQYQFNHETSISAWPSWSGVMHNYDIDYVFGLPLNGAHTYTAREVELAAIMMNYWTNFAETGDPNQSSESKDTGATWPSMSRTTGSYLVFQDHDVEVREKRRARQCAFWNSYLPALSRSIAVLKGKSVECGREGK